MNMNNKLTPAMVAVLLAGSGMVTCTGMAWAQPAMAEETQQTAQAEQRPVGDSESDPTEQSADNEGAANGVEKSGTMTEEHADATSWTVDGVMLDHDAASNTYTATLPSASLLPQDTIQAVNSSGAVLQLTMQPLSDQQIDDSALGVVRISGTAQYIGRSAEATLSVNLPYSYEAGTEVDASYGGAQLTFVRQGDGFSAAATTEMDAKGNPSSSNVLVNGQSVPITWDGIIKQDAAGTTTYTRTGTANGEIDMNGRAQHWGVAVVASRTEEKITGLNVLRTDSDGNTTTIPVNGFSAATSSYELTLPAEAATDAFELGVVSSSSDALPIDQSDAATVNDDGSRVLSVTANGTKYTVAVHFAEPVEQTDNDNPDAKLEGIYVNYSGKAVKGDLIDGWDPDVTDYTLTIGQNDPSVYILPVASDGVTVTASDAKQTGYATEQEWKVTAQNGSQQRTYKVRVVREHAKPTAPEAFNPSPFKDVDGKSVAPANSCTELKSHGYVLAGKYHAVDSAEYTIPQGGSFAYASYSGQTVTVKQADKSPMRYVYDLSVIAPNGIDKKEHQYITTYLTPETHEAALQSILVNNSPIEGFSADRTEYTVAVPNIAHWVVTTKFDKTTGMSVTVHKDAQTATIDVTSADGLVHKTYIVHITEQAALTGNSVPSAAYQTGDRETALASTGSSWIMAAIASLSSAIGGLGLILLTKLRRTRS